MVRGIAGTVVGIVAGLVVGVAVALLLLVAVELFSAVVHPVPQDFDGSQAAMCAHVENYPAWVLAVVVPLYGGIALGSTWLAGRIGGLAPATILGVLLLAALVVNVWMLPYPMWFEIAVIATCLLAVRWAVAWVRRHKSVQL